MFFLGLGIILFPRVAESLNTVKQSQEVESFKKDIAEKDDEEIEKELSRVEDCYNKVYYDEHGIHDPFEESNEKLNQFRECLGIEKDEIFASLEIPKLNLSIPIYLGSSKLILDMGVGQVEGSSLPLGGRGTHTVLAAHRGMGTKAMFRNLDELYEGDVFYIHGSTGTLKYRVTQQRVIYPYETSSLDLEEDKDMATLLTCHPYRYNYQRLLIHGERFEEETVELKVEDEKEEEDKKIIEVVEVTRFWKRNNKIVIAAIGVLSFLVAYILFEKKN